MKKTGFTFHGDGKEIAASLKHLGAAVDRSAALPILSCVALEVMPDGRLTARATDLDVASQVTLPVTMEQGNAGAGVCVAADLFSALLTRANGDGVRVVCDGEIMTIEAGARKATLHTLPLSEFPEMKDDFETWTPMSGAVLAAAIRGLAFCVSSDETRAILNGIYLSGDGLVVATDGKRLAMTRYTTTPPAGLGAVVVPTKALAPIADLLARHERVEVAGGESGLEFRTADERFFTRRIEGNYPNYQQVIPNYSSPIRIAVDRAAMRKALAWAKLFVNDKDGSVKLVAADGVLSLSTSAPDRGEAEETLPILSGGEAAMRVAINLRFLEQFVAREGGEHFVFEDPGDQGKDHEGSVSGPIVIREDDEDFLGIIMPMRINH